MSLFPRRPKDKLAAIFDIGSGSVGGALVLFPKTGTKDSRPKILYANRLAFSFQKNFKFEIFLSSVLKILSEAASNVENARLGPPAEVHFFLDSPWCASQTRIARLERKQPFIFNSKLAGQLISKESKVFEESKIRRYIRAGDQPQILEKKNIHVALNGYQTTRPLGMKAREAEIVLFLSVSPGSVINSFREEMEKFFKAPFYFSSFTFSSFAVVRDLFPDKNNFLLVDVRGEVTDISMIKNDILVESFSFPLGKNFIIRSIMSSLNKDPAETLSLFRIYLQGKTEAGISEKLAGILKGVREQWMNQFQNALSAVSDYLLLPKDVFIVVDQDLASWFVEIINEEEFSQYVLTSGDFDVILLESSLFDEFCDVSSGGDGARDPFLILETLAVSEVGPNYA